MITINYFMIRKKYLFNSNQQKIADKLEDKYHTIKNELGYEFLIYKEIKLIKILNKPNNYIIINSKQKIHRPLDNKDIN